MHLDPITALVSIWDWTRPGDQLLDEVERIVNVIMPPDGPH